MKKISTRIKRKFRLNSHHNHYHFFHPAIKKNRPRTFGTKEAADAYALAGGIKDYSLKAVKHNKRFQIEVEDGKDKNITG